MNDNQISSSSSDGNNNNNITIPSSDLLHLLQCHLIECGLHATSSTLRAESGGIGLPGLFPASKGALLQAAQDGRWGEVLQLLDSLDLEKCRRRYWDDYSFAKKQHHGDGDSNNDTPDGAPLMVTPLEKAVAMVHEMAILELAEQNEVELAYAALRMCSELLDGTLSSSGADDGDGEMHQQQQMTSYDDPYGTHHSSSRSGDVERRIVALSAMRDPNTATPSSSTSNNHLPPNYYGPSNPTCQKRRDQIAKLLRQYIPEVPLKRLSSLLQQSIKWQCHTGVFPTVQRLYQQATYDDDDEEQAVDEDGSRKKERKKKKHKSNNVEQRFDLVLGNVDITLGEGKKKRSRDAAAGNTNSNNNSERIPSRIHQTIRLGKRSFIECACFLPDGRGIITGSSDGFIEIWGEPLLVGQSSSSTMSKKDGASTVDSTQMDLNSLLILPTDIDYEKLRTSDLPYQRTDDLMMHAPNQSVLAMNVSHDGTLLGTTSSEGTVYVWKISDGKLLRKIERAHGGIGNVNSDKGAAVTCIQFSPDGSKILTGGHDSTCREFGLLSSRMLKEFRGHTSYVNCCSYIVLPQSVLGVGGGGNGGGSARQEGNTNNTLLAVVTGSADGTVRVWDGRSAEPIRVINPPIIPTSIAKGTIHDKDSIVASKSIHTILHLHTPPNTMVVIPRCEQAYLMSYSGTILRAFTRDDKQGCDFLAGTISSSNQWLFIAADDGECVVFDVSTGKMERIIRSFAADCTSGRSDSTKPCEITGLVCHPHRGFIGGYSNDKGQKRGMLTLWK